MQIEFVNLSTTDRFAGASHEEVCKAFLSASCFAEELDGGLEVVFDARYIGDLVFLLAGPARGAAVRILHQDRVVVDSSGDADDVGESRFECYATDTPIGRALVERAFVALLLRRLVDVTLHDPERIWIEAGVRVDPGAILWGGAVLRGTTHIGAAEIGTGVVLIDTRVADGAVVKPYSVCELAHIGPDSTVGPMAHLRANARLSVGVKVGNFVEVKNTTLHAGAKVSHLSYLGDAEIGAEANIGAGTITCNYDGFNKWRTEIGAGAFIGSNTALVAPVKVLDGAVVAAGSTITREVPADALAICRAEQKNLPGMGRRIRNKNRSLKERRGE